MLRSSIQVIDLPGSQAASVGPSAVYGAIHEFGGVINIGARSWRGGFTKAKKQGKNKTNLSSYRKRHSIGGASIRMPARPYMRPALAKHRGEVRNAIIRSLIKGLALKT